MEYRFSAQKSPVPRGAWLYLIAFGVFFAGSLALYLNDNRLVRISAPARLESLPGATVEVEVGFVNKTRVPFSAREGFFLGGRLGSVPATEGRPELPRVPLELGPGARGSLPLRFTAPAERGDYLVEIDIVKEGEYWLADKGNRPLRLRLRVGG